MWMAKMKIKQNSATLGRFYWGLVVFALSASTLAFVTDPFLMADMGLIILGIYLMITGLLKKGE